MSLQKIRRFFVGNRKDDGKIFVMNEKNVIFAESKKWGCLGRIVMRTRLSVFMLICALFLPVRGQEKKADVPKPTRKERMAAKKERLKLKVAEEKEKLRQKKQKLQVKAREKKAELIEKGGVAKAKADSILDVRNSIITTDTMWVARPQSQWIFRAKTDVLGDLLHIRTGEESGFKSNYYLQSEPKVTVGMMANYRGISLSLSLSPTSLLSDFSDMVSAINYYSNTFGIDFTLEKIDEFRGRTSLLSSSRKLGNTNLRDLSINGYYVFNGKRFSYPAVFNSTWVQKRSAGSFLVQANFSTGRLKIGDKLEYSDSYSAQLKKINMTSLSIGAGYGYNYVAGKHWLVHATLQPSVTLWKNYKLRLADNRHEQTQKMPANLNLNLVGRAGAIYSWSRYFAGVTSVVQYTKMGKDSDIALRDTNWKARAFFGWHL